MEVNNGNNDVFTDPDVNINSWIFIEKHTLNEPARTEFYFEDQARIQELNEDDLKSTESNSDSDGISVISENEEFHSQEECCTCISKIASQDDEETNENIIKNHYTYKDNTYKNNDSSENLQILSKDSVAKNKIIYITTVTGMCFLATYFFWPKTVGTHEYITDKILYSELDNLNNDITNDDILNDVYDKQIWNHYEFSNNTCDFSFDLSENKLNSGNSFMLQAYKTIKKDISMPVVIQSTHIQNNENQKVFKNAQRQIILNNKSIKNPNSKKDNIKKRNKKDKTLKFKENYLNKKDKYLTKKEKYLKKLEKEINLLEAKLQQTYGRLKKESDNCLKKSILSTQKNFKINSKEPIQQNMTGDWYHYMYSGRSEIRHKEKLSDWVFERSKIRSKLREKDSWYFSRAKGREQSRSNKKFHPRKYKTYKTYRY